MQPVPPQPPVQDQTLNTIPPAPAPETVSPEPAVDIAVSGPLLRIGLITDAKEIGISSSGEYYLTEKIAESSRQAVQGEIRLRVEKGGDATSEIYRVQVASFTKPDLALELKNRLTGRLAQPVVVRENSGSGLRQVRVGEFSSKEETQPLLKTLAGSGYPDAFVVKEEIESGNDRTTLGLRGPQSLFRLSEAGFLLQPSSRTAFLRINGKPYRGNLEITLNKDGRMTVVNQVGMEEYLLGVVPAEMSPTTYPEPAGLSALAIAARTYALKNMGRFNDQGFDLSNDTRTQVYGGVDAERNMSSEAVQQTAGLAIYYQDKLINAMYMSTCGGRTEDFANVFDSDPVPYLKSVFCASEIGPEKNETVLQGKHDIQESFLADDGSLANRNLEFARALGIIDANQDMSPEFFSATAEPAEVIRWVESAGKIARRLEIGRLSPVRNIRTRAGFLQYAAESFFGVDEIKRRISSRDVEYYMGNLKDGSAVPEAARQPLSYIIQNGIWRPNADNTVRPDEPIRRGDAISLLLRWVESARPEILKKAAFVSAGAVRGDNTTAALSINVKWGNRTQEFRFSANSYLFRLDSGRTTPVGELRIIGNEKLSFHVGPQGLIDFLEVELNPTGAASDRYSPVASWDTTLKRSAISEKLRGMLGDIGELRDLQPYRLGNSGRALQIKIVGSRNSTILNGYKVGSALGLRSTLFSIARDYNPDGTIASFTFRGRGWGHGVGLCQVGAYGMARAGRSYEEIIKTYYQGVQIRKAY